MKKILLGLLFVGGAVNCQNLPTYPDDLQNQNLITETWNTINVLKSQQKIKASLLSQELQRCKPANDCDELKLANMYVEYIISQSELAEAEKSLKAML